MDKPVTRGEYVAHFIACGAGVFPLGVAGIWGALVISLKGAPTPLLYAYLVVFGLILGSLSWATTIGALLVMLLPGPPGALFVSAGGIVGITLGRLIRGDWRSIYSPMKEEESREPPQS